MKAWRRIGLITSILTLVIISRGITGNPVHAQNRDSSDYQLTMSQSSATSTFGESYSPIFIATLVHPATGFSLSMNQWFLIVDNVKTDGFLMNSAYGATTLEIRYSDSSLSPGVHTFSSTFQPQGSSTIISSNVITHTVQKATPDFLCQIDAETSLTFSPGHQLQMHMVLADVNGIDTSYNDGTYTITFSNGNATVTDANLTVDKGRDLHVPVPTAPGTYELLCAYNGSSLLNPAHADYGSITVSAGNSISGVQVYSSLAQLSPNKAVTLYIVLHGTAGLPPPSGTIALSIGDSYHTTAIELSGSGDATIQTTLPDLISSSDSLGVYYYGDRNYNVTSANFSPPFAPLPNQTSAPQPVTISTPTKTPLPSSGSGHPPVATATSIAATESTPTPDNQATATHGALAAAPNSLPPTSSSNHATRNGDSATWIILIFTFLILGGSGGVYLYFRRRRVPKLMTVTTAAPNDIEHGFDFSEDQLT